MSLLAYIESLEGVLAAIKTTQADAIRRAGGIVAGAFAGGGILHVFGAGHSHMISEEAFFRAGGLAPVNPILDSRLIFLEGALASTYAEREPGYAAGILDREDVRSGDASVVVSNSGRNAVPVEVAMAMRERGVPVIAITNLRQSAASPSRHPSGKRLFELADLAIDNCVPEGDAAVRLPGLDHAIGPCSTVAGAAIMNSIMIEAASCLLRMGAEVPLLVSANLPQSSDDAMIALLHRWSSRIRYFA